MVLPTLPRMIRGSRRRDIVAGALAVGALALAGLSPAAAQGFPSRQITLVVPFAAGGPSDVIARLIGQSMSQSLGQQVVIENVAGAGGTAGATRVAKAEADGHTLLIHHLALAAAPALYQNLTYDTRTAFVPLGLVNTGPMVLAGRRQLVANNAAEVVAWLKDHAEKSTMAHAGVGSNSHLCAVLLSQAAQLKVTFVAYRGTGPAMNDVVGGQVDMICDQSTTAVPQIQGGAIKGYAVTSPERLDVLPSLPTAREMGLPGFEMTIWHGLYAPKGTPAPVVAQLNAALAKALNEPAVQERFKAVGTASFPQGEWTPAAHEKRFLDEVERWGKLLKQAGVQPGNAN
jgi:tripartite-type tricarboxylate transporter receptor subunit TctC